ncbi:unnamed protein product [Bursaphelenchus xylophilus]|uniref:(pine wood nematode) hypothetical protein n=1 Tax=Bursaphelenchus xylophilus TaxID=6326 RepID=A0A1I7SQQ0_BURXY|nr:unnamed protein product [Bursaphelenchus xylophilus]CAG9110217.1 unnamed protein product [Bursaphelenchus xylophilus]
MGRVWRRGAGVSIPTTTTSSWGRDGEWMCALSLPQHSPSSFTHSLLCFSVFSAPPTSRFSSILTTTTPPKGQLCRNEGRSGGAGCSAILHWSSAAEGVRPLGSGRDEQCENAVHWGQRVGVERGEAADASIADGAASTPDCPEPERWRGRCPAFRRTTPTLLASPALCGGGSCGY